jgi:hypothetical protein
MHAFRIGGLMRVSAASLTLLLAACGDSTPAPPATGAVTDADRAAILGVLGLTASADGEIMNECGELSTPQFLPAELGGSVGTATLFAMSGGPNTATCYGDGPDLHLFRRDGASWREIYSARGRVLIILPTSTGGVRDIGDGGPGFSFPVWVWNGSAYAPADREIGNDELSGANAKYLP